MGGRKVGRSGVGRMQVSRSVWKADGLSGQEGR